MKSVVRDASDESGDAKNGVAVNGEEDQELVELRRGGNAGTAGYGGMDSRGCRATVAVCTYNGAERLGEVFAALERQTLSTSQWEVVVVDNASTDGTQMVAERWLRLGCPVRGRVVNEREQGLSFARERAAREASGELLCFLDDDNIPEPEWLERVVQAFASREKAGVIGGRVLPRWVEPPTALAEAVCGFALAIVDHGPEPMRIGGTGSGLVGAGMCVRRDLLLRIFEEFCFRDRISDRRGEDLISGGDLAISVAARLLGMECWYEPGLRMEHVLPENRMGKEYLMRLFAGIGRGQAVVRRLEDWRSRTPLSWLIGLKDLFRWAAGVVYGDRGDGGGVERDLHDLHQEMVLGRAQQALRWPRH